MTPDPRIRASDQDRERVATLLREHHAVGRLTAEEFDERLDKAFAAKTMGELDELLADLPGIDLYKLPDASLPRQRGYIPGSSSHISAIRSARPHGRFSAGWRAAWGSWFSITLVLVVIWALSGFGYPWFAWIVGPWGAIMVSRWISGSHPGGGPDRHRELPDDHNQLGGPSAPSGPPG